MPSPPSFIPARLMDSEAEDWDLHNNRRQQWREAAKKKREDKLTADPKPKPTNKGKIQ